ncbi:MAG: 5-formyltetrahydrofolate cyclo-ligase [Halobacteriales archaeon]
MGDKEAIRQAVWDALEAEGAARFPFPPHGRIPNFAGADAAAERLTTLEWWAAAEVVKANPDAPQRPVRERALRDGIAVLMAQPRLRGDRPFWLLDPAAIDDPAEAATIGGAEANARALAPEAVPRVDAVVVGSVAVDRGGRRIGKGEGYSDLEFAALLELGRIDREVDVATTVHPRQLSPDPLPTSPHDVPVDHVATPETVLHAIERPERPTGIDWASLDASRLEELPALAALRPGDGEPDAVS